MTLLRNLTPHQVTIQPNNEAPHECVVLEPEVEVPRVAVTRELADTIRVNEVDVAINVTRLTEAPVLPDEIADVYLIVSRVVAELFPQRKDLLIPDELVRDASGAVIGCRALSRITA